MEDLKLSATVLVCPIRWNSRRNRRECLEAIMRYPSPLLILPVNGPSRGARKSQQSTIVDQLHE